MYAHVCILVHVLVGEGYARRVDGPRTRAEEEVERDGRADEEACSRPGTG